MTLKDKPKYHVPETQSLLFNSCWGLFGILRPTREFFTQMKVHSGISAESLPLQNNES